MDASKVENEVTGEDDTNIGYYSTLRLKFAATDEDIKK